MRDSWSCPPDCELFADVPGAAPGDTLLEGVLTKATRPATLAEQYAAPTTTEEKLALLAGALGLVE